MRPIQRIIGSTKLKIVCLCVAVGVFVLLSSFNVLHLKSNKLKDFQRSLAGYAKGTLDSTKSISEETSEKIQTNNTEEDYDMNYMPYLFKKNSKPGFIFGVGRRQPVSVVIGIPHVKRPSGDSYLNKTLDSLTKRIFPDDEDKIAIVVFIAEKDDQTYVENQAKYLYNRYRREFDSGMLQVIGPPEDFYPDFEKLIPNLGDSMIRVQWRSKEVIDAALLMLHCEKMADHYLMLEDDVIAGEGYMRQIIEYLDVNSSDDYLLIATAHYGSIGKLFRSRDIPVWVSSFLAFYNLKPIDWLLEDTNRMLACSGITSSQCDIVVEQLVPVMESSLFLHVGYKSSLSEKESKKGHDEEKKFGNVGSVNKHRNPPVEIFTTIKRAFKRKNVYRWYKDSGGLVEKFCLHSAEKNGNIQFQFKTIQNIGHILLKTGSFGSDFDSRLCEACAALEVTQTDPEQSKYSPCAVSDWAGSLECKFLVFTPLTAFRIVIKKPFERKTCFSVVYVKALGI